MVRTSALLGVALALGLAQVAVAADGGLRAEIRRTAYGVPHIKARDIAGLGYGAGYVSAQDNFCDFAERMMTVDGERSRHLGPGDQGANIVSDLYHRSMLQSGRPQALLAGDPTSPNTPSPDARAMARGFIAGINRYVRDVGAANLPDQRCRGAAWIRTYTELDFWRNTYVGQIPAQMAGIAGAAPPGVPDLAAPKAPTERSPVPEGQGSNAWALGREMTKSGHGVLLGNPHYPWDGNNRFYRMHYTIPGKINVVGAGLMNSPSIGIGHNDRMAWTHTVSTARRFSLYELKLDPANPAAYLSDGRSIAMTPVTITLQVKTDQGVQPLVRTLYATRHGPVIETAAMPWTGEKAYAMREARVDLRGIDQYLKMWRARSVRELSAILGRHLAAQFNTTAVDAGGEAFYGDVGALPFVTDAKVEACLINNLARAMWKADRIAVLDGSRAACDWDSDPSTASPGLLPARLAPQIFRNDFTSNSNDSYWLTNPRQPLTGYPRILGEEATTRSLRTRMGMRLIEDRMDGADGLGAPKFDLATVQGALYANRNLGAELVREDLVALCQRAAGGAHPDLTTACKALAAWDTKVNLDSRGAHVFRLFAEKGGLKFKVAFDPKDPVRTPHTLDVDDPKVLAALVEAVRQLQTLRIPMDAPLGQVQSEPRRDGAVPIHGGPGPEGIFNVITPVDLKPERGWTKIRHGSSWIMVVEFTPRGPVSQGILTYSQSADPASPNAGDQTWAYSQKTWDDLRFTEKAVRTGTVTRQVIEE
jgi:acyl-homoserine-lactone acylase